MDSPETLTKRTETANPIVMKKCSSYGATKVKQARAQTEIAVNCGRNQFLQ